MIVSPLSQVTAPAELPPPTPRNENHIGWRASFRPNEIENLVLATDVVLIVAIAAVSGFISNAITGTTGNARGLVGVGILSALNFVTINVARSNYRLKALASARQQIRETIGIWPLVCGLLSMIAFAMKVGNEYSRGAAIIFFISVACALVLSRFLASSLIWRCLATGSFSSRKIIVIAEKGRAASSTALQELQRYGLDPVKIFYLSDSEIALSGAVTSLRQKLFAVLSLARTERVEAIYVLVGWNHSRSIDVILDSLKVLPLPVHLIPDNTVCRFLRKPRTEIGSAWLVQLKRAPLSDSELAAKRCFDVFSATMCLLMFAPLLLLTAALIKFDSTGPALFRQKRNGFNGRTFDIYKFRTMYVHDDCSLVKQATRDDPRITRLGRWLRKTSIDELPQLLNVLRGDMSMVGPRPHACSHNTQYEALIASYAFRYQMKPGLTGWAQVNGYRGETSALELMEKRVAHDLWYINNWSFSLDFWIAMKTMIVALGQSRAY